MKYAVIDTESSGLFDFKRSADAEGQPRLAQLAVVLLDDNLDIMSETVAYVRPDGWEMSPEATEINGLTTEMLMERGVPVQQVLEAYTDMIVGGRAIVAHNAQFDCKTMRAELRRAGMDDLFERTPNICTMRGAMGFKVKKLNGKGGFPGLADVCAHFGIERTGEAHDALADARAAAAVFKAMVAAGFDREPKVHYAKDHDAIKAAG